MIPCEFESRQGELVCLSNSELLDELSRLETKEQQLLVEILLHLNEVDRRKLYLEQGSSSLFDYCLRQRGWSESAAGRKIAAARAMKRFPEIYELLLSGELTLSAVAQVAAQLTQENHESLLARIRGRSRREVEAILASGQPAPRTRDRIRPLGRVETGGSKSLGLSEGSAPTPGRVGEAGAGDPASLLPPAGADPDPMGSEAFGLQPSSLSSPAADRAEESEGPASPATPPRSFPGGSAKTAAGRPSSPVACSQRPHAEPRYEIRFSVGEGFVKDFERVGELLSGRFPGGLTYEGLFGVLIEDFLKRKDPLCRASRRALGSAKSEAPPSEVPCTETDREELSRGRLERTHAEPGPRSPDAGEEPQKATAQSPHERRDGESGLSGRSAGPEQETMPAAPAQGRARSRHIPLAIRDQVIQRDRGHCGYVSAEGVRCESRWDLELDHVEPFCRGGAHSAENLRLRCRAHNLLEARRRLGEAIVGPFSTARGRS